MQLKALTTVIQLVYLVIQREPACILSDFIVDESPDQPTGSSPAFQAGINPYHFKFTSVPVSQEENMSRSVTKAVLSRWTDEGVGARVRRSVGRPEVNSFRLYSFKQMQVKSKKIL